MIASHNYPIVGPYDSGDLDLIEYHLQLMKLAGIDGIIIDWYGTKDFQDYGNLHRNTVKVIESAKQIGLRFAVCYEDQSLKQMMEKDLIQKERVIETAVESLSFVDKNWFSERQYLRISHKPVLLVFGPQFLNAEDWGRVNLQLKLKPLIFGLPHLAAAKGMDGKFGWPPVSGGKEISRETWSDYISRLHQQDNLKSPSIAVAFPGFHDIYKEAGLHDSYGFIDARQGKTLAETLVLADKSPSKIIQLATWNDFGEGTVIEPTQELGFEYLNQIYRYTSHQKIENKRNEAPDFQAPLDLYLLKKAENTNPSSKQYIEAANRLLNQGKAGEARLILDKLKS